MAAALESTSLSSESELPTMVSESGAVRGGLLDESDDELIFPGLLPNGDSGDLVVPYFKTFKASISRMRR